MYPSSLNTVWYLPVGRLQILKNSQTCSCHEIILQVTRWIILFSSHNWTTPPPLVLTENVGFNSSCSRCAQDSPHKSLPFLYVTSKLQTEKCPGTPEAEQIFSTTTLHVPQQPAECQRTVRTRKWSFYKIGWWLIAPSCTICSSCCEGTLTATSGRNFQGAQGNHIPWCFRTLGILNFCRVPWLDTRQSGHSEFVFRNLFEYNFKFHKFLQIMENFIAHFTQQFLLMLYGNFFPLFQSLLLDIFQFIWTNSLYFKKIKIKITKQIWKITEI